ncbi:MAG: DUF5832 domain-containing protein [Nitrososphaerota archaeon]
MSKYKTYKVLPSIDEDAPFNSVSWYTVSFLDPQKIENLDFMEVRGIKIHNGYTSPEMASEDAKKIKKKKKEHDVFIAQIGKVYAWNDDTRTESIEYDNDKLNELEKTRRENMDKLKLMAEQFKNERRTFFANHNERREQLRRKIQQKLYERGLITKQEFDLLQEDGSKNVKKIREDAAKMEKIMAEMDEVFKVDYLDENDPVGFKYGCISLYSPKKIRGLKIFCFKVRGLFETMDENEQRIQELSKKYPNDRIYRFEVGRWCAFSERDDIEPIFLLKQLNYCMKCYLEKLAREKEEFEKRKEELQKKTEQESKTIRATNRRQRRQKKVREDDKNVSQNKDVFLGNPEDDAVIQKISQYLDDPELRNKFAVDPSKTEKIELNIN